MSRYRKPLPSAGLDAGPGRSGEMSLSSTSPAVHALQAVAQEVRVEADLERLAAGTGRARVSDASPMSGVCADTVSSPSREGQPQRRVLLRQQGDAAHDVGDLAAGQAQLVLVGVGQQLAVVGELPVDQPRGQHDAADLEDDLVGAHATRPAVLRARRRRSARAPAARAPARWPRTSPSSGASSFVSLTARR